MRKDVTREGIKPGSLKTVAALSLSISLAAFGCTTNRTRVEGESTKTMPAVSNVTPSSTGASVDGVNAPASGVDRSTDALATIAAREQYRGKVLGQAAPATSEQVASQRAGTPPTGQFVSPSLSANPQLTVNSSISSPPVPVVNSEGEATLLDDGSAVVAPVAIGTTAVTGAVATTGAATVAPLAATTAPVAVSSNLTNTTATAITGGTVAPVRSAAPTPVLATTGAIAATPAVAGSAAIPSTTSTSVTSATNAGGSTLGTMGVGIQSGTTAAPVIASGELQARAASSKAATPVAAGQVQATTDAVRAAAANNAAAAADRGDAFANNPQSATASSRSVTTGRNSNAATTGRTNTTAATSSVRVETAADGSVTVTNAPRQSLARRIMNRLGIGRNNSTSTTSTTTNNNQ